MLKRHCFLPVLIILNLLSMGTVSAYAQGTPTEDDTLEVSSFFSVPAQTTIAVGVKLKTTRNLAALEIPLKFRSAEGDTTLDIECDSIHWSDWVMDSAPPYYTGDDTTSYVDSVEKEIIVYAGWSGMDEYLPSGSGTLFTIYFTTGAFWTNLAVEIDTFMNVGPPYLELVIVDSIYQSWIPVYIPGILGGEFTPANGDVNCDDKIAIEDVVYLVRYLFKSGPPPCD